MTVEMARNNKEKHDGSALELKCEEMGLSYEDINFALGEICDELGLKTADLMRITGKSQPVVYRWLHGTMRNGPHVRYLPAIEALLGIPQGEILRRAGYVKNLLTIPDYIRHDSSLSLDRRNALVDAYLSAKEATKAERFASSAKDSDESSESNADAS